jgi:hypothetical protein
MEDKNQSAFPWSVDDGEMIKSQKGMTLRDYFAAKAMQGMLAACTGWSEADQDRLARSSYRMANEMMKARTE